MRGRLTAATTLAAIALAVAPISYAQDITIDLDALGLDTTLDLAPETPSPEWHTRFTLNVAGEVGALSWNDRLNGSSLTDVVEIPTGAKWGFTLGIPTRDAADLDFDTMSAGAFFNLTPRMRIGGQFSFTSPEAGLVAPGAIDRDEPEVKLESAFRF